MYSTNPNRPKTKKAKKPEKWGAFIGGVCVATHEKQQVLRDWWPEAEVKPT